MIQHLFRYPVKSMRGEELLQCTITTRGLEGDRTHALIDEGTGRVVSAKQPVKWQRMLELVARRTGADGQVAISFPDGDVLDKTNGWINQQLSAYLGRTVRLAGSAPDESTIDRLDPFVDGQCVLDLQDRKETTSILGRGAPAGTFFDYAPIHLLTTATLRGLAASSTASRFETARFRPNLVLDIPEADAFVENEWEGALLHIGEEVILRVERPTPRCAIPTLAQPGLPYDVEIIRAIARRNTLVMAGGRRVACAGAYAQVERGGTVRVGDAVSIEPTPSI